MIGFLDAAGWADATATPLAGDASARCYTRLTQGTQSAILMQDPDGDTALFARLARHLTGIGLSAPRILAEAPGLLLLEDLGDGLIARLAVDSASELTLYRMATDALVALHRAPAPSALPIATPERLTEMIDLAFTFYAMDDSALVAAQKAILPILVAHATPTDVMILRDYHAENILDLTDRAGPARAGLLDFQDAMQGHRAYDLVSLLEDARRDVSASTTEACIAHYIAETGAPEADFRASYAVLGAQRNLRILGVFARLAANGKPRYVDLIPRVWHHLQSDLRHPVLAPLRPALEALPKPDATHLDRLRQTCPTP